MPTSDSNVSNRRRREAARAEALALRRKQAALDRRHRAVTLSVLSVAGVALVAVLGFVLIQGSERSARYEFDDVPLAQVADAPATARRDGGIPLGSEGVGTSTQGAPELGIYFDYLCPFCGDLEQINGDTLEQMVSGGDATVIFHPVAILDRYSAGAHYSTRAAAAAAWIADKAPEAFFGFHQALYAHQPDENTAGLSDQELARYAVQAGVPQDVADAIADGTALDTYGQWVYSATRAAAADKHLLNPEQGAFTTPTLTLDGTRWDGNWTDPTALPVAVAGATTGRPGAP